MNKEKMNNTRLITGILVIILIAIMGCAVYLATSNYEANVAKADTIGLNGKVEDGYRTSTDFKESIYYKQGDAISSYSDLKTWLEADGTSTSPKYGYLTTDISWTKDTTAESVQYHYLDGCGYKITITSNSGSITGGSTGEDPIIVEDAAANNKITSSAFKAGINYLDSGKNEDGKKYGDNDKIISTYENKTSPFGYSTDAYGFYTAGYLGSILAYSSISNTNVVFEGTYALDTSNHGENSGSANRGLSIGIMFGYLYNSGIDNCSLTINGKMCVAYGTAKNGQDLDGVCTVCMGGYAGTVDNNSQISNSKIHISSGACLSGYAEGGRHLIVLAYSQTNHPRVFVGGITGCLLNNSTIYNITATGSGNLRAWGGGYTQDSGTNRMGLSGIIAGSNVSAGPATSLYSPVNAGSNSNNASSAASGTINGVICSWTGVAMSFVGSSKYIYGATQDDLYYHTTAVDGKTKADSVGEYFYGGCICAASESGAISGVFYTFEKNTLADITFDTYRYLRSAKATGGDGYGVSATSNSAGVQPVIFSDSIPSGNYLTLQMQQTNGLYKYTTGEWHRASYTGTGSTQITIAGKTYYADTTFSSKGYIEDGTVQTSVFGLEWSGLTQSASVIARVDATKVTGYSTQSGMFVWSVDAYNGTQNVANKACYRYANSAQEALTNYRQYDFSDSIMARSTTNANYVIKASIGYAGTYLLEGDTTAAAGENDDPYTYHLGQRTFNATPGIETPTVNLYTYNMALTTPTLTPMKVVGTHTGVEVDETKTIYTNASIWKVYKQGSAYMYGFSDIEDAGTYKLRVHNGKTSTTEDNFKFDFLDETNKIVSYKADNKYYDADSATSLWQPTYTYTINQKEIIGAWKTINNTVDSEVYTAPEDFIYTGKEYNFAYLPVSESGYLGSDPNFSIPTIYELITYARLSSVNLERNNSYYLMNDNGEYYLFGEYQIDGDNKYFKVAIDTSKTFYRATGVEANPYEVILPSAFEVGTTYYVKDGENYVEYGTFLESGYVSMPVSESIYYRRVYKSALDIKNAGSYRITVNDCNDSNYKLSDSLQREWFVTVTPRTIEVFFRDMDNIIYNSQAQKVTWAAADETKTQIRDGDNNIIGTADVSVANIVVYNVFDASAINVTFDDNFKEFTTAGKYFVTVSLASGAVANNYYLPGTIDKFESEEHETIFDEYSAEELIAEGVVKLELNDKDQIIGVTRIVTIKQAEVGVLRQYTVGNIADAAFIDSEYGTTYNYYNAITNPVYVQKNITFMGEAQTGYFETEDYKGFNTLPCVIKGVTDLVNPKYFDLIYCDPIYYPAKLVGDTYVVDNDAVGVSVISAKGIYVAKLTFDSEAYINYAPQNFYVVYDVIGVNATITIDTSSLEANREYDMQDHTSEYANSELNTIASVSGLVKVDELKGADVNFKYYVLNDETEDANAITVNTHKYEPIATIKDAGSYIMVIAHDSISEASYYLSFENTDHSAYAGPTTAAGDPYFAFEITQIPIKVRVTPAEKMYSYAFNSEIHYEVLTGEDDLTPERKAIYDQDKANIVFKFTSEGFAAGAEVGQYDMAAACEGTSAKNYTFEIVNETKPFTVKKYVLTYSIGNIEKEYGEIFDFGYRPINLTEVQFNGYKAATTLYTKEDVVTYPLADAYAEGVLYFLANDGTQPIAITNEDIFGYYKNATQLYVKGVGYNYPETTEYVPSAAYYLSGNDTQPITVDSSALFAYYKAATALYTKGTEPEYLEATAFDSNKNYFLDNAGASQIALTEALFGYYTSVTTLYTKAQDGYIYTEATGYDSLATYYSDEEGTLVAIADQAAFEAYEGTLYTRTEKYVYTASESYAADTQYYVQVSENVFEEATKDSEDVYNLYTQATTIYEESSKDVYTQASVYALDTQYYVQVSENVYEEATKDDEAVFGYYTIATTLYIKTPIDVYNPIESTATFDSTADYYLDNKGNDQVILDATTFGYYKESHNIYKKVVTPNYDAATEYAANTQYYIDVLGEKIAVVVANAKEFDYYTIATAIYVKGTNAFEEATAYATNVQYYLNEPVEYTKTNGVIRDGDTIDSLVFAVTKTVNEVLYNGTEKNAPTGAYEIVVTPTGTRASNYSIEIVGRFTVIKKTITLDTITANANLVYDATEKAPTVTFNGVYEGDEVIAEITYNGDVSIKPINAGEYTIKVTGITGAHKDNYIFNPTTEEQDAEPFTITKRNVTVDVDDFTMGYGDTKLVPSTGKGYALVGTSDDFVYDANDKPVDIAIEFNTTDPALMNMTPGQHEDNCVSLIISGDAVDNYNLTINTYGNLTVNTKALVEIELKESSMEYTGENLKDSIELDTNGTGVAITEYYALDDDYTGDDAVEYNAHTYKPTEEIINHGEYLVKIEVTEGEYYSGDAVYKTFAVDKATWLVEDFEESDISVNYNSITFGGKFAQYKDFIRVSRDGTFTDFENDVITGLNANTRYEFYVKILELDNYNESAVMRLSATTTYDPNQINSALDTLGTEFGYTKIADYKKILQDYNKVADVDKALVNATKFSAATARYDKLMSAGTKAVTITKQIAGKAANKTYQVAAAASVGGAGLVLAGLSCLFINKKKKQNKVKEEK
ncbi:MAG: hypothetical protein E7338_02455 [Clostridiales bacterium]|nr:hypothetical protein [Clostridiales bacterium]